MAGAHSKKIRASRNALVIADFCNKICQYRKSPPLASLPDWSAMSGACACSISGRSGVGEKPSSAAASGSGRLRLPFFRRRVVILF
jgi:hypothetical protein